MIKKLALFAARWLWLPLALLMVAPAPASAQNAGKVIFASSARTATTLTSGDQINNAGNSIHCILDTTAFTSGSVTMTIQGKDPASLKYYTLLAGAAVVGVSTNVYKVGPGLPVTANVSANDVLPGVWRISITGASTPISTYSVGCSVID